MLIEVTEADIREARERRLHPLSFGLNKVANSSYCVNDSWYISIDGHNYVIDKYLKTWINRFKSCCDVVYPIWVRFHKGEAFLVNVERVRWI